jgi:hypothetical protein
MTTPWFAQQANKGEQGASCFGEAGTWDDVTASLQHSPLQQGMTDSASI